MSNKYSSFIYLSYIWQHSFQYYFLVKILGIFSGKNFSSMISADCRVIMICLWLVPVDALFIPLESLCVFAHEQGHRSTLGAVLQEPFTLFLGQLLSLVWTSPSRQTKLAGHQSPGYAYLYFCRTRITPVPLHFKKKKRFLDVKSVPYVYAASASLMELFAESPLPLALIINKH